MKKLSMMVVLAAGIACTSFSAIAADETSHGMMDMNSMDTNHDGMISKDEYMQYYEAMWEKMPKNSSGMVSVKDMKKMMMKSDSMEHGMMKNDMSPNSK